MRGMYTLVIQSVAQVITGKKKSYSFGLSAQSHHQGYHTYVIRMEYYFVVSYITAALSLLKIYVHDEPTVVKVWNLITCLNVKFLPIILKYVWTDDVLVLTSRNR
jgi:hypothetical protein